MKVTHLALLVASTQSIALKNRADTDLFESKQTYLSSNPHIGAPDPYLEDDHRIILQATPDDKRWTKYTAAMKGEATH